MSTVLLMVYLILIEIKFQFQWDLPKSLHGLPFVPMVLIILELTTNQIDYFLVIISLLLVLILGIFGLLVASTSFTTECDYNPQTSLLEITFNKLFMRITERYTVSPNAQVVFHSVLNPGFLRKSINHSIEVDNQRIPLVPINVNGFPVVNKLMKLLSPEFLKIENLPKTNAKIIFPTTKYPVTIPNHHSMHLDMEIIPELTNLASWRKKYPKNTLYMLIPILLITILLGTGFIISFFIILSFMGSLEPAPLDTLIFLFVMISIIIIVGFIQLFNFLRIAFGNLEIRQEDELVIMSYSLLSFKPYELKIHQGFNPRIRISKGLVDLVIVADPANTAVQGYVPYFYEMHLGKISADDEQAILSKKM